MGRGDSSPNQGPRQWIAVAEYADRSVTEYALNPNEFVRVHLGEGRSAVVEIALRDGRLAVRAPDAILEICPAAGNTAHVQVRSPFGDVYGGGAYVGRESG